MNEAQITTARRIAELTVEIETLSRSIANTPFHEDRLKVAQAIDAKARERLKLSHELMRVPV